MPRLYRITGADKVGVIRENASDTPLRETGFEPLDEIVITSTRAQFLTPPDPSLREIVEIDSEPHSGRWLLVALQSSISHHFMTCKPCD